MVAITALNGRIPVGTLVTIDRAGHQLRADAAAALDRLSVAMVSAGHGPIVLSAGFSAYRTLAEQDHMIALGLTTMPAGQSQHGEAVAADIAYLGGFAGARYRWLAEHGREYGWAQPKWATAKGSLPEPWHWEYDPADDQHAQEDDMALTDDDVKRIADAVWGRIIAEQSGIGPASAETWLRHAAIKATQGAEAAAAAATRSQQGRDAALIAKQVSAQVLAAVQSLPGGATLSEAQVQAAVRDALAKAAQAEADALRG